MNGRRVVWISVCLGACVAGAYQLKVDSDRTIAGPTGAGYGQAAFTVGTGTSATLAVGAPNTNEVYLHRGMHLPKPPFGTFGGTTTKFTGPAGSEAGWSFERGQFVGDGTQDLVIGAPSAPNASGRVYIIDGDDLGTGNLTAADAAVVLEGLGAYSYGGWSLAAGDYNGDGWEDLAVGACGWTGFTGAVYVAYGPLPPTVNLANTLRISGKPKPAGLFAKADGLGCSLEAADLDLDWDDELIAPTFEGPGMVHVLYELPAQNTMVLDIADRVTYTSARAREGLGQTVAVADVNDDLAPDLILGGAHWSCDQNIFLHGTDPCENIADSAGQVYAVLGVADDHVPGVAQTLPIATAADVTIRGTHPDFGRSLAVGDVDDDDVADVLIGQPRSSQGFLFYGDAAAGTPGNTQLDTLDAEATFSTPDSGGASAVQLADFTGDKKGECTLVTMGQPWVYRPAVNPGATHIVFGE